MKSQKPALTKKTKIILIISAIVLALAVIIGGVLWLTRDDDDIGPLDQEQSGDPNDDVGNTPWDEF